MEEGGGVDPMWVDAMEMIDGDLHWLLQLPHQTFWCQVGKTLSLMCQIHREVHVTCITANESDWVISDPVSMVFMSAC